MWWLVSISPFRPPPNRVKTSEADRVFSSFTELPGLDKLDSNKWNGVTKEDFVRGALESYRVHGNHADTAKYEGPKGIESFIDKDWGAAGTVPIEVCSRKEAVDGFKNTRNGSPKTVCPDKSGV